MKKECIEEKCAWFKKSDKISGFGAFGDCLVWLVLERLEDIGAIPLLISLPAKRYFSRHHLPPAGVT